ncbi:MAG: hypothetical protein B6D55_01265 [Candidatus Omnitrophica bacterium 4484_70.2]|nr:MAG: hypothetical protein B6D55_01265 [Candidatus Omnitrophica bacterium 4484_70.2]
MHRILFKIGSITIYTYGFFVFLGILVAYLFSLKEAKREGVDIRVFSDILFWCLIIGFIGARTLFIIVEFKSFLHAPFTAFYSSWA